MNRPLAAVFSAMEALLVVAIGLGIVVVPLTLMWGFQYGLQIDWAVFWRASVDIWLLGHGADMRVTIDAVTAAGLGLPAELAMFPITIALLGFALLTVLLGQRAGRRIAETPHRVLGLAVAIATFGLLSFGLVVSALHDFARPSIVQGTIFPTLIFAGGLIGGASLARHRLAEVRPDDLLDRLWRRATAWPSTVKGFVSSVAVGGVAIAGSVLSVASVIVALLVALNYGEIIGLYEGAHAGVLGGFALTLGQLALVPNLVIWGVSWLVGPGFAIGAGSTVSPLGTALGPVPAIPVFGALPTGDFSWGFLGLLVPLVFAFLVGMLLRRRVTETFGGVASPLARIGVGVVTGLVAGAVVGLLAWWSGGAVGPGRLAEVGPDALMVALWGSLEFALGCALGLLSAPSPKVVERSRGGLSAARPAAGATGQRR